MVNRIVPLLLFFGLLYCFDQKIFFINHLVEQNGKIVRPITNEPVIGDIYRYFGSGNMESKNVFIGTITTKGKNGNWIRWWDNGEKKSEGRYINSVKEGFWTDWTETGEKFSEILYKNGSIIQLKNCLLENCD